MSDWSDVVLISDPRVTSIGVLDDGSPLTDSGGRVPFDGREDDGSGDARLLREQVLLRLLDAATLLPADLRLVLNEGYRSPAKQRVYFDRYVAHVRAERPEASDAEVRQLASRFISPPEVAPHSAGAALDVLLTTPEGIELDVGCPIDTTPEKSGGRCYTAHPDVTGEALLLRRVLVAAMSGAGLVNYPTEWWHWSYGDRYWAHVTGAPHALFGLVDSPTPEATIHQ